MEIVVEETLTGAQWRELIIEKYGSVEALRAASDKPKAHEAQDDLLELEHLENNPDLLARKSRMATYTRLKQQDLRKLTPARLKLLDRVSKEGRAIRVMDLAKKTRRNEKNVSQDVRILAELGLLRERRVGREKFIRPRGLDIHIRLEA